MHKKSSEDVRKILKEAGYNMLGEYETVTKPILAEKNGYLVDFNLHGYLTNNTLPILFGKRCPYYKQNIALFISRKSSKIELVDVKFVHKGGKHRTIVTMRCECGDVFTKDWTHIVSDKSLCCSKCANQRQIISRTPINIKTIEENGYEVLNKSQLVNNTTRVEVLQKATGYKGYVSADSAKRHRQFIVFSMYTNQNNYVYNVQQYIHNNDIDVELIGLHPSEKAEEYQKIDLRCACGNIFTTTVFHLQDGKCRCNSCSRRESANELEVKNFLISQNIAFRQEYKFNGCKDIVPLPFDFHLTDYDVVIEVDGEQHYQPVRFGGMSQEQAAHNLALQQNRDKIKSDYCAKNNIPLLRLSFMDIEDLSYQTKILTFIQTTKG